MTQRPAPEFSRVVPVESLADGETVIDIEADADERAALVGYMRRQAAALDALGLDRMMAGDVGFGPAPGETRGVSPRQRGAGDAPAAPGPGQGKDKP